MTNWVLSSTPIVVIGEGQAAVDEATRILRLAGHSAESMGVPKDQWRGGELTPGMPQDRFQKAVDWNKKWLTRKMKAGYKIVDIGPDGRLVRSRFYEAELEAITENKTARIRLKILPGGESIADMRTRISCK